MFDTHEVPPPPENVERFLKATFSKCLPTKRRRLYSLHPRADKDISNVLGRDFPRQGDQQLAKVQKAVLAASGPLIGLWSDLSSQGFSGKSYELMPVKSVIEVCQQSLALVGNASCFINELRSLGSFLQEVCKDLEEPSRELFGLVARNGYQRGPKDFNESLRSLDSLDKSQHQFSKSRFLGGGLRTKYESSKEAIPQSEESIPAIRPNPKEELQPTTSTAIKGPVGSLPRRVGGRLLHFAGNLRTTHG